jgi:hypothetical protein
MPLLLKFVEARREALLQGSVAEASEALAQLCIRFLQYLVKHQALPQTTADVNTMLR